MYLKGLKQGFYLLLFLMLAIAKAYCQEVLPSGCSALVIKDDLFKVPAAKYSYIFIHNLAPDDIWIINQTKLDEQSLPLSSKLEPGKWASLVLNKQQSELQFVCVESRPGHEQQVSCQEVLAVCNWPSVKLPENSKGVFFVAESMELSALSAYSERNGYALS